MAHDAKRGRVFAWLDTIAKGEARYCKSTFHPKSIFVQYGFLYATNGIVLAEIEFPEFNDMGNDGFMIVKSFTDSNGYYLETPELEKPEVLYPIDYFKRHFITTLDPAAQINFNPRVLKDAMKPFEIYKLHPHMVLSDDKCELTAHNRDVSMRIMMMGVR